MPGTLAADSRTLIETRYIFFNFSNRRRFVLPMDEDHSTSDVRRALALLQKHLEFDSSNIIRTIDDLSAAHPELATALKTVGLAFRAGQELPLSRSLQDLPREEMDGAYDITAVLDSDAEVDNLSLNTNVSLLGDPNRYVVQAEVARGGMGVIYRVQDKALHRTLAMKVMSDRATHSSQASSASVTSRFHEEAQVTAQLDHPGIVSVHELSVDSAGRPFFTMKLVKGREFSEIVQLVKRGEEGWSLSRAVGILVNICQTVAFAHSKNVIHRDLKPANIMVGRFGEVYVMDWGLAKIRGRDDLHDLQIGRAHA